MANLTRWGIAYNVKESPYYVDIEYELCVNRYKFSSELYKGKFQERLLENRIKMSQLFKQRYNLPVDVSEIADLQLYRHIEKRGFYIERCGEGIECPEQITFVGELRTMSF